MLRVNCVHFLLVLVGRLSSDVIKDYEPRARLRNTPSLKVGIYCKSSLLSLYCGVILTRRVLGSSLCINYIFLLYLFSRHSFAWSFLNSSYPRFLYCFSYSYTHVLMMMQSTTPISSQPGSPPNYVQLECTKCERNNKRQESPVRQL